MIPESANAVSPTEATPTLQVVASRPTKDGPAFTLSADQGRKVFGRIDTRDPKVDIQGEKKTRRGRGKRKGKDTEAAGGGTENVPPPTNQQNTLSRRRRARRTGYVDIGTRPAPRRGRATSGVGGAETANVASYVAGQPVEGLIEDGKTTGRHTDVDRALEHGGRRSDAGIRPKRGRRRLPSQGDSRKKPDSELGDTEIPKTDKETAFKTAGGLASDEDHRRSAARALSPCGETILPEPTTEGDVSTVQPLPSSTRRRAKEYFQRRTRERSVDAVGRHARPPNRHRHVSMVEQETRSSAQILRRPNLKGSIENASVTANRPEREESMTNGRRDQFVFDPEASPFTPNATSSPRQASLSSIVVQSFSSPTPLPSHGNRNVVPLVLPETSDRSDRLETNRDAMIPISSHDIPHGLAYTYAGANQAQAHIQAEQISLMRLQAYYNWLAGSMPTTTGAGIIIHQSDHMEMSGGGGGLSGGVVLGRHAQIQGLGKGQRRNASSAYSHPKEHIIFSPRDHERTEHGSSQSVLQNGIVQSGKGESENEPEGTRKWDGRWGLREVGASGKEIGWSWGRKGPLKPPSE